MRSKLTKTIPFTHVKLSRIELREGKPVAVELGSEKFIGKMSPSKVQKEIEKVWGKGITVYDQHLEEVTYEMDIRDFIQHASIKEEK